MKCLLMVACLSLTLPVAAAEVFRWTDQNGQVHYGQRPPPQGAQRMELPQADTGAAAGDPIVERRSRERRLLDAYDYERSQKKARQAREDNEQQATAARCAELQRYWRRLSYPGPLYAKRSDGGRDYLSDEQRAAERARVLPAYVQACGSEP